MPDLTSIPFLADSLTADGPCVVGLAFGMPGNTEWIVLLVLGLLIFGRRLPEVGRSLGRGIVEFKKGIKGIEDEIDDSSSGNTSLPTSASGGGQLPRETAAAPVTPATPVSPAESTPSAPDSVSVGGEGENPYRPPDSGAGPSV